MLINKQFLATNSISWLRYQVTARSCKDTLKLKVRNNLLQRSIYSCNGVWEDKLSTNLMKEIESYWKPKIYNEVASTKNNSASLSSSNGDHDYYVLSMFPYPSGQLHMGHVRVYSISDAMAHYYRMSGPYRVLHPMGWDAFGLPAENAAIERNLKPQEWTSDNILKMKEQLNKCGFNFDWDKEISTCDPLYYKWTQWIFLKMYEAGLAYQKSAIVNWDPADRTVLADEQVDSDGRSWRSGAKVEKRNLKQWFLRTTQYSKDLYDGLDDPTLKDWRDIKKIQQNWIGQCNGVKFYLKLADTNEPGNNCKDSIMKDTQYLSVWTETPEMVLGISFVGMSDKHVLAEPLEEQELFTAEGYDFYRLKNFVAENPFSLTNTVPIIVFRPNDSSNASYNSLFPEGCDTFLGTPDISELHFSIMKKLELDFIPLDILSSNGYLQNCKDEFKGLLAKEEGRLAVLNFAKMNKLGGYWTSSKLQDWPISRQRYWGTPIPMVKCNDCGTVPVKEESLPVILPELDTLQGNHCINYENGVDSNNPDLFEGGGSPLLRATDWINVDCPKCGKSGAKRETDTMDTFVDSSWYFLRYLDPNNNYALTKMCDINSENYSKDIRMPVDLYIGGKEHATLHMFFARFVTHFLHSIGVSPVKEPFKRLLVQGMVKGKSYKIKGSGKYIPPSQVKYIEEGENDKKSKAIDEISKQPLVIDWEKMSKSKYNGADPNEVLDKYGMDATRLLILSDVSPLSDRKWDPEDSYIRIHNMLTKILRLVKIAIDSSTVIEGDNRSDIKSEKNLTEAKAKLWDARNFYVRGANNAYSGTRNLSMVMARVQGFLSELSGASVMANVGSTFEFHRSLANAIILLTPLAPHFCAEMWSGLSDAVIQTRSKSGLINDNYDEFLWDKSIFHQPWPTLDDNYNLKLKVIRNGKELTTIPIAKWKFNELNEEDAFNIACCVNEVQDTVLPHQESMTYKFELQQNYEGILSFYIKEPELTAEEKLRLKETKKEEKLAKKRAREARIAARNQKNENNKQNSNKN